MLQVLKEQLRHVAEQWDLAETALDELEKVKAWKKIPPEKPYGSKDAMLKAEVGLAAKEVRRQITTAKDRARALDGKTVSKHGGDRRSVQGDVITLNETGKGTSAEYLTRRIARDHPDIFERMKADEYASVRAAALDAGILHPRGRSLWSVHGIAPGRVGSWLSVALRASPQVSGHVPVDWRIVGADR